ncbi:BLOC-2 complex member HPS6 [Erpetoichthys calabaricus]|uniref:BLOC-2 complex member HPS6 n=1 Tax=Erpetoichthys calabaricus TaxID=27687 RepID=UPI00109F00EA|nr:BLOC-2 complex member HPS6 [Erpetoichthys calabaricus]
MKGFILEKLTDLSDFTRSGDLLEVLNPIEGNNQVWDLVRVSPDERHIHVLLPGGLWTFDRVSRAHPLPKTCGSNLDLTNRPVLELLYLDIGIKGSAALVAVVLQNGRVEFWKYSEQKSGWDLLQTSELCDSSKAKVVSVCHSGRSLVWCEERLTPECTLLRYCVCWRSYEVEERSVHLGGATIALINSPIVRVLASGDLVYMLPCKNDALQNVSKFFLTLYTKHNRIAVCSLDKGELISRHVGKYKLYDFKKLLRDCIGVLAASSPPQIRGVCPTGSGGLLLTLGSRNISLLEKNAVVRQIFSMDDNHSVSSTQVYGPFLAFIASRTLYILDIICGQLLEKITLKTDAVLSRNAAAEPTIHLLSGTGLYSVKVTHQEPSAIKPDTVLAEFVFEEACKYYQRRSLSSTQLTVEKLKNGGMFQAPIALSSIIGNYLQARNGIDLKPEKSNNSRLLASLDTELKSLLALEELKSQVVATSEMELASYCETLVEQEIRRLLYSDMEADNLQYLNFIFRTFSSEFWQALQSLFQFHCNGEVSLSTGVPPEVWKTVLCPAATSVNNRQQQQQPLPVFELICHSFFRFQPKWLPKFVELAQQQSGTTSWKDNPENTPLYKRALALLPDRGEKLGLEVELLLCSQRPNAIMQAFRILIEQRQWEQVTNVAKHFSQQSPLLNKEIFTTLLSEVSQHRDLDPYLDLLWSLCPEDMTVTSILNIVLKSLPPSDKQPVPFLPSGDGGSQMTIGVLKPLLDKVLQRETKPREGYADILHTSGFPPPTPPRVRKGIPSSVAESEAHPQSSEPVFKLQPANLPAENGFIFL